MEPTLALTVLTMTLLVLWVTQGLIHNKGTRMMQSRRRATLQAKRHLSAATEFLAKSKPKEAQIEAEKAITCNPRSASSRILKAISLQRQNRLGAALRTLSVALSPPLVKTLSSSEQADALLKRAEIVVDSADGCKRRRLDAAVADVESSLALKSGNPRAYCLLGRCYVCKGLSSEARRAYQEAVSLDPCCFEAHEALSRIT